MGEPEAKTIKKPSSNRSAKERAVERVDTKGYATETIRCRIKVMKRLVNLGANLLDPESVKEVLAKAACSNE